MDDQLHKNLSDIIDELNMEAEKHWEKAISVPFGNWDIAKHTEKSYAYQIAASMLKACLFPEEEKGEEDEKED